MGKLRTVAVVILAGGMASALQVPEDPVLKARSQRAQALGISEGDLPPVPRTISEPPPLPPPETNYKDTRKGRAARRGRSVRTAKSRRAAKSKIRAAAQPRKKKQR